MPDGGDWRLRPTGDTAMSEHTYKQFDAEIETIRSGVLSMGASSKTQLSRAIAVLTTTKVTTLSTCRRPTKGHQPDAGQLDQLCSQIIARRQPAAIDLRFILMITKIVNELER